MNFNSAFEAETVDKGVKNDIHMPITDDALPFRDDALIKLTGRRFPQIIIFVNKWKIPNKN